MLFSSIPFLYYFLPGVILLYFAVPKCLKNSVILFASLFFYAWGEPEYLIFMLISITQGYIFGILIEKYHQRKWSKLFLAASVLISLGLLGYCKYADFFIRNFNAATGLSIPLLKIALPIGISFYTFQILSYVIDVYRGDTEAQKNYINLAAYGVVEKNTDSQYSRRACFHLQSIAGKVCSVSLALCGCIYAACIF